MKKAAFFAGIFIIITSCASSILYRQPQPSDAPNLNKFPKELRGKFYTTESLSFSSSNDTLFLGCINKRYILWQGLGEDTIIGYLSDSIVLRQIDSGYFLNVRQNFGTDFFYWKAFWVHHFLDQNHMIVSYLPDATTPSSKGGDSITISEIAQFTTVDSLNTEIHIINPTPQQLKQMMKINFFRPFYVFRNTEKGYFIMDDQVHEEYYEFFYKGN